MTEHALNGAVSTDDTAATKDRVLVAGIGNLFLSDDGFGVEVANRLAARGGLPDNVEVADIGIRGMHLAYQLLDGYRALLLVDTAQRGGEPGTLYLLEHDLTEVATADEAAEGLNSHGMDPASVLALLHELSAAVGSPRSVGRVLVVGCEPATLDEGMGLSPPVAAAVDRAVTAVVEIVGNLLTEDGDDHHGTDALRRAPGGCSSGGTVIAAGHGEVPGDPGDVTERGAAQGAGR